jgi:CRP-like cAMP-binding protein
MQSLALNRRILRSFVRSEPWSLTNDFFPLSSFESFGEEVLSDQCYRQNTVLTKEKTILLSLQNSSFRKVLRQVQKEKKSDLKNFLRSLELFSPWASKSLDKILDLSQIQTLSKNQLLYRQGDQADFVFFIKEGEFLISKTVKIAQDHRLELLSSSGCLLRLSQMRQKSPEKNLQVAIKGKKEILGAEEVLENCTRRFACVCITDLAVVVKFSKENFLGKVLGSDNLPGFKRKVEVSKEWTESRIEEIRDFEVSFKDDGFQKKKNFEGRKKSQRIQSFEECEIRKSDQMFRPIVSVSLEGNRKKEEVKVVRRKFQVRRDPPPSFLIGLREKIEKRRKSPRNDEVCYTLPF